MIIKSCLRTILCVLFFAVLSGCGGGSQKLDKHIGIDPEQTSLSIGQQQTFRAITLDVNPQTIVWKVKEGDVGGNVVVVPENGFPLDYTINYTAPQTVGTYHVQAVAAFSDGETQTATATVEVK